jgi:hypothetical protein
MSAFEYNTTPTSTTKSKYSLGPCPSCGEPIKYRDIITRVKSVKV